MLLLSHNYLMPGDIIWGSADGTFLRPCGRIVLTASPSQITTGHYQHQKTNLQDYKPTVLSSEQYGRLLNWLNQPNTTFGYTSGSWTSFPGLKHNSVIPKWGYRYYRTLKFIRYFFTSQH